MVEIFLHPPWSLVLQKHVGRERVNSQVQDYHKLMPEYYRNGKIIYNTSILLNSVRVYCTLII